MAPRLLPRSHPDFVAEARCFKSGVLSQVIQLTIITGLTRETASMSLREAIAKLVESCCKGFIECKVLVPSDQLVLVNTANDPITQLIFATETTFELGRLTIALFRVTRDRVEALLNNRKFMRDLLVSLFDIDLDGDASSLTLEEVGDFIDQRTANPLLTLTQFLNDKKGGPS